MEQKLNFRRLIALTLFLFSVWGWGQTTINYSFSALGSSTLNNPSGNIDANISYVTAKNSSSVDVSYNSGDNTLRLYYGSNPPYNGGSITLTPSNGAVITSVKLGAVNSYTPTVKYNVNGGADVSASLANTTYTISNVNASTSLKIRNANTSNTQLRLTSIEVTYTLSCIQPTNQSTNFSTNNITQTSAQINWTRGNGDKVLVVAREGAAVNATPTNGSTYSANPALGLGDQIGTGNFVVYNGSGTNINITDLLSNKNYYVSIYEYNNTNVCYNITSPLLGNFTTLSVPANHMQYVNLPTSGLKNVNLSSFSIEARTPQNTIDTNFNGSVTLSKLSGNGTMSGTLTKSFVNGIATFNDVQFDIADTYTINASATGLPQVTSGNIVISDAIVYQKITSLNDLTDGEYVIVADSNNAMNNTVTSSKLGKTSVTVLSNQISDATPEIVWTITTDNGNIKTIYNSNSNKFISGTSSTNLTLVDAVSTVGQKWEATFVSNLFRLINQQDTSRGIYYNGTSFGRYVTGNVDNSSYFAVSLFKKVYVSTSTIWTGSSWSNGAPTNTKDAAINGVYSGAGFVSKSLTVNAGKSIGITSGGAIETGAVTNNGSILIKDGANFNHSSYSGSGAFSLEKATTSNVDKFVFWSSPVAGQNMYNLYTLPSPFVMAYNTATDYYDTLANPTTGDFGKGYSVKVPVANGLASFTGTPNNGTQTVTVNNTANANGNAYNLIGNPYPSNLDLVNFYLDNISNVGQNFYFWSPNVGDNTQFGATATVNPGWAVYNANTTTWSRAASGSNSIIRPGQAFIVKALTTGVVFNNTMRTVSNTGVSFFNKNAATGAEGKYWLQLAMPNQTAFQMAVTYGQGASNAYDNADSKLMSVGNDNIYSIAEGNKLAIQGRTDFVNTDVVTLGNRHSQNGNYTISLVGKTGVFDNGQAIYLRDKQLDTYADLTQQAYSFVATQGELSNRFEIVYQPQGALSTVETTKENLKVYRDGEVFVVENAAKLDKVTVLDASGRVVKVLQPNTKKAVVEIPSKGMYLLNILSQGKEQVKKIIK